MRVTIIPEDGFVSVDGEGHSELDLSSIDPSVHAVQWYSTEGAVEYKDEKGRATHNEQITSLDEFQPALDAWQAAKDASEAEAEANKPTPEQLRIAELKGLLASTDFKVLPDYDKQDTKLVSDRQAWREEIRALEAK
jgi:hypothetical protein